MFLLAAGDTYAAGSKGGSANAVVVSHTHSLKAEPNVGSGGVMPDGATIQKGYSGAPQNRSFTAIYSLGNTGESGTGKNMPPYLAVYVWRKIS